MTDRAYFVGVDGCRAGWVCALVPVLGGDAEIRVVERFAEIAA